MRYRLQAQKYKFTDDRETEERIINQIIKVTQYPDLQKRLLSKNEMSIQEVLNICRSHEALINYMKQMGELPGKSDSEISAIKSRSGNIDIYFKCTSKWEMSCSWQHLFSMWSEEPLGEDVPQQKSQRKKNDRKPQTNWFKETLKTNTSTA